MIRTQSRCERYARATSTCSRKHLLPPLPYDYGVEPIIDARTMMLHHDRHHASYVEKNVRRKNSPSCGPHGDVAVAQLIRFEGNPHCGPPQRGRTREP